MANNDDPNTESPEQELIITRVFDAPRELVFKAWTEPEHFVRWWGPKGYTTPSCTIDLRPGGVMHHCMRSPEGREVWTKGVFREIVVPGGSSSPIPSRMPKATWSRLRITE